MVKEDFVKVAETKDIQTSQMIAVEVYGEKVCLANVNGKYCAIGKIWLCYMRYQVSNDM
jgi:hypothetical protein